MNFRSWYTEWEGTDFPGDSNYYVNTPDYWPNSKWQGKGNTYGAPSFMSNVEKMYKMKKPFTVKRMNKKGQVYK